MKKNEEGRKYYLKWLVGGSIYDHITRDFRSVHAASECAESNETVLGPE